MFGFKRYPTPETALVLLKTNGEQIKYSWSDYYSKSLSVANELQKRGVKPGDFIAIIALNLPESFFALRGTILTGAVPVPINVPLVKEPGQKDLKSILSDCRPKLVLANQCLDKYLSGTDHLSIEDALEAGQFAWTKKVWHKEDLLVMPYTSGTTGGPKGVMLSFENIFDRVKAVTEALNITYTERLLSYLSLGHISELIATFFGQIKCGYQIYFTEHAKDIVEDREKFRKAFPSVLQAVKPTVFLAVPKVWINMRKEIEHKTHHIPVNLAKPGLIRNLIVKKIRDRVGFNRAKCFISAGSKLSGEDRQFFAGLDIFIDDIYGQTETGGPLMLNGKVLGKASVILGKDEEILVAGPSVMLGYFNNSEATNKVLENGSFHTGDAGVMDAEGKVFYGGRLGDSFKLAQGEYISSEKIEELENETRKIKGVSEAIVCGDGKPGLLAIIFSANPSLELEKRLASEVPKIGQGIYNIKKFMVADPKELELTPTLKVKRRAMLKKFENEINSL